MRGFHFTLILLVGLNIYAQENTYLVKSLDAFLENNIEIAQVELNKSATSDDKAALNWHLEAFMFGVKDSILDSDQSKIEIFSFASVLNSLRMAEILNFHYIQKDSLIFEHLNKALTSAKKLKDTSLIRLSYRKLLQHNFDNNQLTKLFLSLCEDFRPFLKNPSDEAIYTYYKYSSIALDTRLPQIDSYKKALEKLNFSEDNLSKGILNQIIGISGIAFSKSLDTALVYLNRASENYKRVPGFTGYRYSFKINNNLGVMHSRNGNPKLGLQYFRKASQYDFGKNNLRSMSNLYLAMAEAHEALKDYDSAYYYSKKEKEVLNTFKEYESALKVREIDTKYQTLEKEKQIIVEQQKKKQNRNIAFALGGLVFFGSITFMLIQKNTKRKQLLAESEKEIQIQKVASVLKNQELNAIDAMIEGQEKERQRIANELHDDLGGLMANIKLHFEALKETPKPELFEQTTKLLDNAYQKIRSVAHTKNSGVMAKKGLLKAINDMATTISNTNRLHVEVIDHGLDHRLENSLELTIFRIIQELLTNVIKHANASEVMIHITNHDDSLNIMLEDNGNGFDTANISKSLGMGISSIDKRIDNLGGTLTIESEINKGTTVIIDMPI